MIIQRTDLRFADTVSPLIPETREPAQDNAFAKETCRNVYIRRCGTGSRATRRNKDAQERANAVGPECHLDFDVPRALDEALQKHALIVEGGLGLAPC